MIDFELVGASDWWMVTIGGSLDDIQIRVTVDQHEEFLLFVSLRELLELYESAYLEIPTADLESSYAPSYSVTEDDGGIVVRSMLNDWEATTTYPALRKTLETLLSEIFASLDQSSTPDERRQGIEYMDNQVGVAFQTLYDRLSDERI